jgi:hypothetical protein
MGPSEPIRYRTKVFMKAVEWRLGSKIRVGSSSGNDEKKRRFITVSA